MKLGITLLRATVGGIFFAHGAQKLFGWFGGHGLEATGQAFDGMGMKPGRRNALLAGTAEAGGGALIAAGLLTPLGSAAVIGVMGQAVRMVHKEKGFFVTEGGYEYNLALVVAARRDRRRRPRPHLAGPRARHGALRPAVGPRRARRRPRRPAAARAARAASRGARARAPALHARAGGAAGPRGRLTPQRPCADISTREQLAPS